jgi:acetyl-CoA decarbonylase/synthase complex subunit delta
MPFVVPKDSYTGKINALTFGSGDKAVTIGGENGLPFLSFESSTPNRPAIALEVQDVPPSDWPGTVRKVYDGVSGLPAQWAKFCQDSLGARIVALRLIGTHPDKEDRSAEDAAKTVTEVLSAVDVPVMVLGSGHIEKDALVLKAAADAAKGKACIIGKAQDENYKTIATAALANNHKLIAMSQLDVNLAKQLNILITQMGFNKDDIIMDPMSSALGYGIEYTYSVMERIRQAALVQNDPMMQTPLLCDIGPNVWKTKESAAPEAELPEWGSVEERGIVWESVTASAMIMAGCNLLVMRHPKAVETVNRLVEELM